MAEVYLVEVQRRESMLNGERYCVFRYEAPSVLCLSDNYGYLGVSVNGINVLNANNSATPIEPG